MHWTSGAPAPEWAQREALKEARMRKIERGVVWSLILLAVLAIAIKGPQVTNAAVAEQNRLESLR